MLGTVKTKKELGHANLVQTDLGLEGQISPDLQEHISRVHLASTQLFLFITIKKKKSEIS